MSLPTTGEIITNTMKALDVAAAAVSDASGWLRSDWHPDAGPTQEQARRIERMRAAIRQAQAALHEGQRTR